MKTQKLRSVSEVKARWKLLGLHADRAPVIFYCGTGWRSSISFVLAHLMGWECKNYDDGWYGWSTGIPESDCRICKTGCGCNIIKDDRGLTIRALKASHEPLCEEVEEAQRGESVLMETEPDVVQAPLVGEKGDGVMSYMMKNGRQAVTVESTFLQ